MATPRRRAPRLFTGAVFTEEVSHGLLTFARRHGLTSDVWVPKRLVEKMKLGVALLPNAILCDVSLMPGCGATDVKGIGFESVLVNAAHTTDAAFFENYQRGIKSGVGRALPLTQTGAPKRELHVASIVLDGSRQRFKSPYWLRHWKKNRQWVNAEETPFPGRYNPTDCTSYVPHTFTNQLFPLAVAQLMRRKASRHGYISRTWLTASEGEAHGTRIDANRMRDGPPIFVSHFSGHGQVQAVEYFCSDQFEDFTVFPTQREIDLAASGVFVGAEKMRGYPLLASLAAESAAAVRHQRMAEEMAKLSDPVLFGATPGLTACLLGSEFKESLRKFSLLRGFSHPYFLLHTPQTAKLLRLKPQEQGIVCNLTLFFKVPFSQAKCLCFFNMEQFEEPAVVEEMIMRTPTFFFIQIPLSGVALVECARAQCANRVYSQMWVPARALDYLAGVWELSPTAVSVPSDEASLAFCPKMYNTSDMRIPSEALTWWPSYRPHDLQGTLYLGEVKMLLSLRAWEEGYTSPLWVTQAVLTRLGMRRRRQTRRKRFLTGKPFEKPPSVLVGEDEYINVEAVQSPDGLLARLSSAGSESNMLPKGV
ncbi:uncharacterized protein Tco025E_06811 [Trypanosoma conorhini]|uniref:Trypanosoma Tc-38 (p38) protein domain-containing protein n=1 Tax=Trypanosoma conorhini TaxID=83891 RepID=A0A422NY44_9TRYP|nr:uncharacterized protein Tco025E_06811 [Trypanosoma conorhini]RNF10365.1 hypothetical protein Tco025E_06811 [Trypanosoma conorhini]